MANTEGERYSARFNIVITANMSAYFCLSLPLSLSILLSLSFSRHCIRPGRRLISWPNVFSPHTHTRVYIAHGFYEAVCVGEERGSGKIKSFQLRI